MALDECRLGVLTPHDLVALGLERLLREHAPGVSVRRLGSSGCVADLDVAVVDEAAGVPAAQALAAAVPSVVLVRPGRHSTGRPGTGTGTGTGTGKVLRTVSIADPAAAIVGALERTASASPRAPWCDRPAGLSERELEVMRGVAAGMTNTELAAQLYLSVNTVKTYLRTGYRKAGVSRRSEAAAWYLTHVAAGRAPAPSAA